ncbi:MAG: pyridoxal 5'-phosphate synthase [Flavobacteriaceae bacterium]
MNLRKISPKIIMISFIDIKNVEPYKLFRKKYNDAIKNKQKNIEAVAVSSYNKSLNEVSSRYVNLKYIIKDKWIFFTNYNSPKSSDFKSHNQISALFYWKSTETQIRLKGLIKQTSKEFNKDYFKKRAKHKNALAISSNQSKLIESYKDVENNYRNCLTSADLKKCPEFWGGYSFTPYYFEFWEGNKSRINKREVFEMADGIWKHSFLQP